MLAGAFLATETVFALAAGLYYFTWGRAYTRQTAAAPREDPPAPGPRQPHRF